MVDHHFPASKRPWNTRHMSLQDLRLQLTGQGCWELRKLNKAKSNKKECPFGGPKVFFLLSFGFFWSCFFFNFFLASKFQFQIVWSDTSWRGMPYDRMIYHRISQPPIYPTNRSCQFSAYHAWSYCSINYHPSIPRSGFSLALFFFSYFKHLLRLCLGWFFKRLSGVLRVGRAFCKSSCMSSFSLLLFYYWYYINYNSHCYYYIIDILIDIIVLLLLLYKYMYNYERIITIGGTCS